MNAFTRDDVGTARRASTALADDGPAATHVPHRASAVIDAGDQTTCEEDRRPGGGTDQRGVGLTRTGGDASDIGAAPDAVDRGDHGGATRLLEAFHGRVEPQTGGPVLERDVHRLSTGALAVIDPFAAGWS